MPVLIIKPWKQHASFNHQTMETTCQFLSSNHGNNMPVFIIKPWKQFASFYHQTMETKRKRN